MWTFVSAGSSGGDPLLRSLNNNKGRQTWEFNEKAGTPELRAEVERLRADFTANKDKQHHSADELLRLQSADRIRAKKHAPPSGEVPEQLTPERVEAHLNGAISFYECLQQDDGHWPGDYGGPMFLLPGLVIGLYTTGALDQVFTPHHKQEALRYLANHQNDDGGFGLHIEGGSTMFGTGLNYVMARLLGMGPDEDLTRRAREWVNSRPRGGYLHHQLGQVLAGSARGVPWDGMNPLTPEMWLLAVQQMDGHRLPAPGPLLVYLPMSYVYGMRGTCKETALTAAISQPLPPRSHLRNSPPGSHHIRTWPTHMPYRQELYPMPYSKIDWNAARNQCAKEDLYYPHPLVQDVLWWALYRAENVLQGSFLRRMALKECMKHIHYEDENTRYIDIGPVNKVVNMLCCWLEDPNGLPYKKHLVRVADYLWVAEDGLKMQGYNGSQLWDTSFAVQALAEAGLLDVTAASLARAHAYVEQSQVVEEAAPPLDRYYRHISKGAWPFSTRDHGWPISDCSSEGLKAALALAGLPADKVGEPIPAERLYDCVNVILSYQNSDGGMATYENTRSFHWLEILNPAETFGDIIVDYSYVECTSACITALAAFRKRHPDHRPSEISAALGRAEAFIRSIQRADGSWYGSWGVCFTYACWFGITGLVALGHNYHNDPAVRRCCEFLAVRQREDGGWGESYLSCQDKVYSQLDGDSHVVNTSWAMLALLAAGYHRVDPAPFHRAARFLLRMQLPSGDWPQQHISGVFNRNCMITYANYRNIFPIWALGHYRRLVLLGEEEITKH
ncbi:hypothetical protein VOLCADRAFT_96220 [Volvox carteri f. nagariensis]|uniref:Terpene cyclase/mutase family member n=2 Tax=Volvox carteri f. nagariensis TaxID=3068 RepID=D8U9J3_VOLCA|nr:uncharacterized protein VOLCADRAFT_96220 [Volvox carteri f. nagariensis]EFJ43592.1 hypothetical protein VOLCADRAFT_96220 [Volvox carteri f. nagariensis]|eukprot:XP_002955292.1 hypothetical protein VOLCADRAFT_96220 [Volvox carteri f. nagariensis]